MWWKGQPTMTWKRRPLELVSALVTVALAVHPADGLVLMERSDVLAVLLTTMTTTTMDDPCANGALVPEQAVPGAYNQACMNLPERTIPVLSRGRGKSSNSSIQIRQEASGSGKTGLAVWNSGLLLVRLLQALPTLPLTVLELGCGAGLVSIAASKLGAPLVLATDGNPQVLELTQDNVQLNHCNDVVQTQLLPWGLLSAMDVAERADLVLGSDLTYNSGTWRVLAETMETVVTPNGYILYLSCGHEGFNVNAEVEGFLAVAREVGLVPVNELYGVNLSQALPSLLSPAEVKQLQSSGGARVVVLQRKPIVKKS
jgi:SAM-dependent methyltransferase